MTLEEIERRLKDNESKRSALEVEQAILELLLVSKTNPTKANKVAQAVPTMVAALN